MPYLATALAAAALAAFLMPAAQAAQLPCGPHATVVKYLSVRHGEAVIVRALAGARIFELFANIEKRTWSVILTDSEGKACMGGTGTDLEIIAAAPPAAGDPS